MTKAYTANFKEKTGSTSGEEPVYLLEITHPQLAQPVRVARDTQDLYRGVRFSLPGTSGNYASTPDSAAVSITGDIDLRVRAAADDWTTVGSQYLISKFQGQAPYISDFSFRFNVDALGRLAFGKSTNGLVGTISTATSSVAIGAADGDAKWLRVTHAIATGQTIFYTSDDGVTWTQLGLTRTIGTGAIFDSTSQIEIGSNQNGAERFAGKVYSAEVRNGIDGPVVARFDPSADAQPGDTSFVSSTGETWTINQSGGNPAVIDADETYVAMNFDIQLPDDLQGKLPRAPIRIDNVGRELTQWIDESNGGRGAQVRVMQVMRDDPDTLEYDVTMDLLSVRQNAAHVTGELGYEDTLNLPALAQTYRPDNTPGIF